MKKILLDLIYECILRDYAEEVEEKDECDDGKRLRKAEEELFAELNEEQIEKVKYLELVVRSQIEYVHFETQKYLLNYAFRLGMEMQKAFDKDDYE